MFLKFFLGLSSIFLHQIVRDELGNGKKRFVLTRLGFSEKQIENRLRMAPLPRAGGQLRTLRSVGLAPEAGVWLWWAQGKARASAVEAGSKVFEGARTWSVQGSVAPWSSRAFEVTQSALQERLWLEGRWGLTIRFGAPPLGSCYASLLQPRRCKNALTLFLIFLNIFYCFCFIQCITILRPWICHLPKNEVRVTNIAYYYFLFSTCKWPKGLYK